jgi:tetratricopeptide (TPR) repeat protein
MPRKNILTHFPSRAVLPSSGFVERGLIMLVPSLSKAIKIFFSYDTSTSKDKRLFDQLANHLSILKRQQLIQECYDSAISAGNDIARCVEAYMNTVDIIVLLISADFFASERCYQLEMKRAVELSKTGAVRLIPVILRPTDWKVFPLSEYSPLPPDGTPVSRWKNIDAALVEVVKGIRKVIEEISSQGMKTRTSLAPPKFPLYHVPYRYNTFFTDRDTILALLSSSFASLSAQALQTPTLALNGLGGIGKTQIALTYLYRSPHYQAILWLNASSYDVFTTEAMALADRLALPEKDREDEQHLFSALKQWLQNQTAWLLVLDQVDDITLIDLIVPPQSKGHVLLTTRTQALGNVASAIHIEAMDSDFSVLFLLHRAGLLPAEASLDQAPAEIVDQARNIAHLLDRLPLALDQAGAYLEETGCSLATYLSSYQEERQTLLSQRGQIVDSHPQSVTITLMLAFEHVARKHPVNLEFLHLLAFLHPDAIPETLLTQGRLELQEPLQSLIARSLAFNQALADLRRFSLISHGADRTVLQIHRIVQDVLIDTLTPEQQRDWAQQAVRLVNHVFPEVHFDTWTECERYLPQAQQCAVLIADFQLILKEGALLLERLGSYCSQRAVSMEAERYLIQALSLYEHHLGADSLEAAQALSSLALLYYQDAQYQQAEVLHLRALKLREQLCGLDDPLTAESLHNLALVYGDQEHYQQAEQIYLQVLSLDEHIADSDPHETAKTLNNLGLTYYQQGKYAQAETAYQRALTLYRSILSSDHPDLAYTLNGLGTLAEKQGDYQQAEELYQQALAIREKTLGNEHPATAHSINKLADIYELQGNDQQAEEFYLRALHMSEQTREADHPDIALFLNNLAFLANKQGHYQQAEEFYLRALHIYEHSLGAEHSKVARVLNNLGLLSRNTGNQERAEELLRRALALRKQVLDLTHPDIAESLSNLADLLSHQHVYDEAETLFQQALAHLQQTFAPRHPRIIQVQEQYASLLMRMNKKKEAQALLQITEEDQESEEHPHNDE